MLTYIIGDLFRSPARVLVNTVNTVGVMGKGIAKDFKQIYPEMFREYQKLCEAKRLDIGQLHLFRTPHKWVLNFPTKKHWRQPSRPEYVEAGLQAFARTYEANSITSIAFPPLGCGNGELDWERQVRPLMERYLRPLHIDVYVHLYRPDRFAPEHRDIEQTKRWLRSEPESLAFVEVWDDLCRLLRERSEFATSATDRPFRVRVTDTPEPGLLIEGDETAFVPQDALLDLWQFVRAAGFVTAEGLTYGVDARAEQIFTILSELPYLKLTEVSPESYGSDADFRHALQLIPRTGRTAQHELFAVAEMVRR
ncbi:MAG: macro domain-containing protein [Planctomycetes bacterium]|nr:macro domain-containing protein [Planctomycetota bacterium]